MTEASSTYTLWHIDHYTNECTGIIQRGIPSEREAIDRAGYLADLMFTNVAVYHGDDRIDTATPDSTTH